MQNQRNTELDILRIVACIMVIIIHFSCLLINDTTNRENFTILICFDSIARSAVPIFFMISGILFLGDKREIDINKIIYKINRLLIAMTFWGFLYFFSNYYDHNSNLMINIICTIPNVLGANAHFWYIPTLIGIYILIPLLKLMVQNKKITKYYLIIWILFTVIKKTIIILFPILLYKHEFLKNAINIALINIFNLELYSYCGYFVIGHYLYDYFNKKINIIILIITTITSQFFCSVINYYATYYIYNGTAWLEMQDYLSLTTLIESLCILLIFKNYVSQIKISDKIKKIIKNISSCTFGIYLIHPLLTEKLFDKMASGNIIITIPILSLFVFIVCFFITVIIKKLPLVKLYIV